MKSNTEVELLNRKTNEKLNSTLIYYVDDGKCIIELKVSEKTYKGSDSNYFDAFCEVRKKLEELNLLPICYGDSLNAIASGMSKDMGLGLKAYIVTMGKTATRDDLRDIFSFGNDVIPSTVNEQKDFQNEWLKPSKARYLIFQIRNHCNREHWYGSDMMKKIKINYGLFDNRRWFKNGKKGFLYKKVSQKVLDETESMLGFELPLLLRFICSELANGGFGPGYGLVGVADGHKFTSGSDKSNIVEQYQRLSQKDPDDTSWKWPEKLLPICDWGCAIYSCIDCSVENGQIIIFDPNLYNKDWKSCFIIQRDNLESWLNDWLSNKLPLWTDDPTIDRDKLFNIKG